MPSGAMPFGATIEDGPMTEGLRIYNLFPTLAGSIADWTAHAAAHRRDGVQRGLRQPVSLSRLLRQPLRRQGLLQAEPALSRQRARHRRRPAARLYKGGAGARAARHHGPRRQPYGEGQRAGRAPAAMVRPRRKRRDPVALRGRSRTIPEKKTVWGDLAELDYRPPQRDEIVAYFEELVRHYVGLGFRGFRCDAAYKVPAAGVAPAGRCREIVRSRRRVLRRESRGAARRRCWRSPRPASTICSTA